VKSLFLALAFVLELIAFVSFGAIGYVFTMSLVLKIVIFIVLLILVITFWSVYMAPRAIKKLDTRTYYASKAAIYTVSAITIFGTHGVVLGTIFVALCLVDEAFLFRHNLEKPVSSQTAK